jgi:Uma2 family endonuclease
MPTAVTDLPAQLSPRRKLWTRSEYEELSSSGLFDQQHLELVEGELIDKMGKNRRNISSVALLLAWLMRAFGNRFVLQESTIDVSPGDNPTSEPQPDLVVLKRDLSHFGVSNPGPRDLSLVIEVADTSLGFDRTTKAALYARAAIAEYWILDIEGRRMIVHRDPQDGRYTSIAAYSVDESVAPLASPGALLRVAEALLD